MDDELVKARNFARTVRYSGDTLTADESIKIENTEIEAFYSLNSIQVTPLVTPVISKSINKVIKRLQIPSSSVKAYVYASPEIQATCYAGNEYDVPDDWKLADWNGAINGGNYNVIFIEMHATW